MGWSNVHSLVASKNAQIQFSFFLWMSFRDEQMLSDLRTIDAGLKKKHAQLEQRRADVTEEELVT